MVISNIVKEENLRKVQLSTLQNLSDTLKQSFGCMGSNTCICKKNALNKYSKDGHTILSNIQFTGIIEQSVKDDIESITRYIVTTVGDGTTSAVILSNLIFKEMYDRLKDVPPYEIIKSFKKVVEKVSDNIISKSKTATPEDIFKISMISTNGNYEVSSNIKYIYEKFGMGVFIDVAASTGSTSMIKSYDGMTLSAGFADTCFINNSKNTSEIRDAHLYVFQDPIDTPNMMALFDRIIRHNIIDKINDGSFDYIPTVIVTPKISRDLSSYMNDVARSFNSIDRGQRAPLNIITNVYDMEMVGDIAHLSGARMIKKYIDPKLQAIDVEKGLAPTADTVHEFYGKCESVVSDAECTKFIRPEKMFDENGEPNKEYKALIEFVEAEIKKKKAEGGSVADIGSLKRRLNSLKANMVEYIVGGITVADRDSLRDLVEDAVKNCRSAATHGYGFGANFEALRAVNNLKESNTDNHNEMIIIESLKNAYKELSTLLYKTIMSEQDAKETVELSLEKEEPMNIRSKQFDSSVCSSIESDIIILDAISKIVSLMFTCNQFICPDPMLNIYHDVD